MPPPTSHRAQTPSPTPQGRRPDESMTLLISMMERPLDPGYAAAAERRVAAGLPPATSTRTVSMLAAAVVVGLLLTLSAVSLGRRATASDRAREQLVAQVEARRATADERARRVQALQAEIDRAQAEALRGQQATIARQLAELALATGSQAVRGPGLTLTLDDARAGADGRGADGDPRTQTQAQEGRVLSKDLQIVTNGLWAAGAEAIAVNGQRLTARSAIRFAGEAILVNYRPLTRPYVIQAIGDPENLEVEFAESDGGSYLRALEDNYGVRVAVASADRLTLPAAPPLTVRRATVADRGPGREGTSPAPGGTRSPTATESPTSTDTTEPAQ